jgi:protein TonB
MMGNVVEPPVSEDKIGRANGNLAGVSQSPAVHDISQGLQTFEEQGTFASLIENFRDALFPKKLPPLELTSQPIAVVDRMAVKRDPVSTAISTVLHLALAGIIAFFIYHQVTKPATPPPEVVHLVDADLKPIPLIKASGGGGGGSHEKTPPTKGAPPPPSKTPIVPPTVHIPPEAKLTVPETMNIPKMASTMPNIGDPHGTVGVTLSNGSGGGAGIGTGNGHGIGSGNGEGSGPCDAGNNCFGIDGVDSKPAILYKTDPEFSEEARKAKQQGIVVLCMWITAAGIPTHIEVAQPLGYGLDQSAMKSVALWKFKPATKNGKPVTVSDVCVNVNFRMY